MKILLYALFSALVLSACNGTDHPQTEQPGENTSTSQPAEAIPPIITYTIVKTYPHDSNYFTEGLEFYKGQLLESSGGNNSESPYPSEMGIADINAGKVNTKVKLDRAKYFGEGITVFRDTLYMLTWTSQVGFKYDAKTFKKIGEFSLPSKQGWGMTHDTASIIMSDGSNSIYFLDPSTTRVKYILGVTNNLGPVANINELEYVNGFLYANQWQTPYILKIDAATGKVTGRLDLSTIEAEITTKYQNTNGLNGIAYNPERGTFFVTGKNWPLIYELKLP